MRRTARWARSRRRGVGAEQQVAGDSVSSAANSAASTSGATPTTRNWAVRLGITTHLHSLRHHSATELLTAGVGMRTVAGRIGHRIRASTIRRILRRYRIPPAPSRHIDTRCRQFLRTRATSMLAVGYRSLPA